MAQSKVTVLVIEDDFALSDAFCLTLRHNGYGAVAVHNGCEALDYLENHEVDAILLDILMPVMDGREFLLNFHNTNEIPIIALSNLDAKSDIEQIVKLGATTYMLKSSVTPDSLSALVKKHVSRTE